MTRYLHLLAPGAILLVGAIGAVAWCAARERVEPTRCPEGSVPLGPRCCGRGQQLVQGHCSGRPSRCPDGMRVVTGARPGCVTTADRADVAGGKLRLSPSDWEAQGVVHAQTIESTGFGVDATEVTFDKWQKCVDAKACRALDWHEPGLPVTDVSPDDARAYCNFVGGRLPTSSEWLLAVAGTEARRFPWGQTGLVCRRAVFGLIDGPCGHGAVGPELAGLRPDGATPDGLVDLAGNVAEWTTEPDGSHVARGGSYRSRVAAELKSWSSEPAAAPAPHIGFRCVYRRTRGR